MVAFLTTCLSLLPLVAELCQAQPRAARLAGGDDGETSLAYSQAMVIAANGRDYLCAGVMIHPKWVLTAAHCALGRSNVRIRNTNPSFESPVVTTKLHPEFSSSTLANNLALLQINSSLVPDSAAQATTMVQLPESGQLFTDLLQVTGWGSISNRVHVPSEKLHTVWLPVMSLTRCRNLYGSSSNLVPTRILCVGDTEWYPGKGICQGDAGVPLVQRDPNTNRYILAGIGSFGFECGKGHVPSVFTAIAEYIEDLQDMMTTK